MLRRLNRQLAVQALYAFSIGGAPIETVFERLPAVFEPDEPQASTRSLKENRKRLKAEESFARDLCRHTCAHIQHIDGKLEQAIEHWRPERLLVADRAILRLAACEILYFPDIPARVTLDEYIELAKKFGDDQSPKFINGVLDKLLAKNPKSPE